MGFCVHIEWLGHAPSGGPHGQITIHKTTDRLIMIFASFNTFFLVEELGEILVLLTHVGRDERCSPPTGFA